jgi:hypothetical protein
MSLSASLREQNPDSDRNLLILVSDVSIAQKYIISSETQEKNHLEYFIKI